MPTEQEQFWRGDFGDQYHKRNINAVVNNADLFVSILGRNTLKFGSVLEFGAGTGMNLEALAGLVQDIETIAVEINPDAIASLMVNRSISATIASSILDFKPGEVTADLVLTKGLLIHIAPDDLPKAYEVLHASTREWLLVCEYFCTRPREINYRGHEGKAWARDFAGEMLDAYKDLELMDYGFRYRRDQFPQDDLTWFLMRKMPA